MRVQACSAYLSLGPEALLSRLRRAFFIDAKTLHFSPSMGYCIMHSLDRSMYDLDGGYIYYGRNIKMRFWAMVTFHGGICGYWLATGSTGRDEYWRAYKGKPATQYMVRPPYSEW